MPDEDAGDEHPGQAAALHRLLHPPVGPRRGHHRRPDARQEHVLEHPERHDEGEDRCAAGDEVVAPEPAEEAQQPETDDEVGHEHGTDVQRARPEESPARLERRGPIAGDRVHERERVGGEQDEQRERARVEPVGEARGEDRRDRQAAEGRRVERDRQRRRPRPGARRSTMRVARATAGRGQPKMSGETGSRAAAAPRSCRGLHDDLAVHRRAVLAAAARVAVDVIRSGLVRDLPGHGPPALGRELLDRGPGPGRSSCGRHLGGASPRPRSTSRASRSSRP